MISLFKTLLCICGFASLTFSAYLIPFSAMDPAEVAETNVLDMRSAFLSDLARDTYALGEKLCTASEFGSEYNGIQGALTEGDCAALFYFAAWGAHEQIVMGNMPAMHSKEYQYNPHTQGLVYIETGSFLGLSSHIVAAGLIYAGSQGLIYCHDLWDLGTNTTSLLNDGSGSLWNHQLVMGKENSSRFARFYANVMKEKLQHFIIPIQGNSMETLRIHPKESAHIIFIDGSHTFENVLSDLVEAWRILKPGGALLGHDCLPGSMEKLTSEEEGRHRGVRAAVQQFCADRGNLTWYILANTMFMFYIPKAT